MIFRQLFEPLSSTFTYLLGCEATGQALLVDPVVNSIDRDLAGWTERHGTRVHRPRWWDFSEPWFNASWVDASRALPYRDTVRLTAARWGRSAADSPITIARR